MVESKRNWSKRQIICSNGLREKERRKEGEKQSPKKKIGK